MRSFDGGHRFVLILLIISGALLLAVFFPIASALFVAATLAAVLWPLHLRLSGATGGHRKLSAWLLTVGLVLVIAVPTITLSAYVIEEIGKGLAFVSQAMRHGGFGGLARRLPEPARDLALTALRHAERMGMQAELASSGDAATEVVSDAVIVTGTLLFQAAMMVIALFFFLLQGQEAAVWLERASPLPPEQTRKLLREFRRVSYAVVMSALATSAAQCAAATIGYLIVQLPHPFFFAALTFVVAFIPALGGTTVCLLCAGLLFMNNRPYAALFLAIWAVLVVALIDNFVKPLIIQHEIEVSGALVFFALVGGLAAFGAVGLLIGPFAVVFFFTLLRMYERPVPHAETSPLPPL